MNRSMRIGLLLAVLMTFLAFGAGCRKPEGTAEWPESPGQPAKLKIVATVFPPYDFARAIAGDVADCEVTMLIKPGSESHSFSPSLRDLQRILQCDLLLCAGGETDAWMEEEILPAINPEGKQILYMKDMVPLLSEEDGGDHVHGHEGEPETDDHVWTSPKNAIRILGEICEAMCTADPEHAAQYRENAARYREQLQELDDGFARVAAGAAGKTVVIGDRFPFRYLAEAYGIRFLAAFSGCSDAMEPSLKTVGMLVETVKEQKIPAVFSLEFSDGVTAGAICRATGAKPLLLHACHNVSREDFENGVTYCDLMRQNLAHLTEALYD